MVNVGSFDRVLRALVAIALIVMPFVTHFSLWSNPLFMWGAPVVGLVLLATSAMKFCPLYYITGLRSCAVKN